MDTCAKCGAGLGVGRFCLNCGHRIGAQVPAPDTAPAEAAPEHDWVPVERPGELRVRQHATQPAVAAPPIAQPPPVQPPPAQPPPDQPPPDQPPPDQPAFDAPPVEGPPHAGSATDGTWLFSDDLADDGPSRLNWWAWVLGALALVAAVMLALSYLGDDDSPAADESGETVATPATKDDPASGDEEAAESEEVTTPPGPAADVARGATVTVPATAPPTNDLDGALVAYDAAQMVDGDAATAWRMAGDGTGAEITLTLVRPAVVDRLGIVNGYAKMIAGVDWYPNNRRVLGIRWTFDDGTSVDQMLVEQPGLQRMKIDPIRTSTVTLTLTAVTPPGTGELGRDYTPISSVVLTGRPVG